MIKVPELLMDRKLKDAIEVLSFSIFAPVKFKELEIVDQVLHFYNTEDKVLLIVRA